MGLLDAPQVGDDAGIRNLLQRVSDLEIQVRQQAAALGGVSALAVAQADLAAQQAFLESQTTSAFSGTGASHEVTLSSASSDTWWAFDSSVDASCTFDQGPHGFIVSAAASGFVGVDTGEAIPANARVYVMVEVLDHDGAVVTPVSFTSPYCGTLQRSVTLTYASGSPEISEWFSGSVDVPPRIIDNISGGPLTARVRCGYYGSKGSTIAASITTISVTKRK